MLRLKNFIERLQEIDAPNASVWIRHIDSDGNRIETWFDDQGNDSIYLSDHGLNVWIELRDE